jgi:hypothetical protein
MRNAFERVAEDVRIVWGGRALTIIGIAGDVHVAALDANVGSTIYTPLYQTESGAATSGVVRAGKAESVPASAAVREAIWSVDRNVPVFEVAG